MQIDSHIDYFLENGHFDKYALVVIQIVTRLSDEFINELIFFIDKIYLPINHI